MQHLFIINPRAGKKNSTARLMDRIDAYLSEFDQHGTDHISVDLEE